MLRHIKMARRVSLGQPQFQFNLHLRSGIGTSCGRTSGRRSCRPQWWRASRIARHPKRDPLQNLHARATPRRQALKPCRLCIQYQGAAMQDLAASLPHRQHHNLATSPAAGQSRAKSHDLSMGSEPQLASRSVMPVITIIRILPHPATPPRIPPGLLDRRRLFTMPQPQSFMGMLTTGQVQALPHGVWTWGQGKRWRRSSRMSLSCTPLDLPSSHCTGAGSGRKPSGRDMLPALGQAVLGEAFGRRQGSGGSKSHDTCSNMRRGGRRHRCTSLKAPFCAQW